MIKNHRFIGSFYGVVLLSLGLCFYATSVFSAQCTVSAATFKLAAEQYENQCTGLRKDCDPINGRWYCSSEAINSATLDLATIPRHPLLPPIMNDQGTQQEAEVDECIDSDGDGWGWDGVASCKISDTRNTTIGQIFISNHQTARKTSNRNAISEIPINCHKIDSGNYHITELVTDLFVTAGQSNATGDQTSYDPGRYKQDKVNNRVLVWTENDKWEVANPSKQTWHNDKYPSGKGRVFNHPGFQIGRAIADLDECRVVAFIATAAPGMPIDHWRHDREGHYSEIRNKVTDAINALPVKHQVDMIWWMQGEADNDQIVSRYVDKLNDLIGSFRSESWFSFDGYFLANETGWSHYANEAIRMLGNDLNIFTDYSHGEDSSMDRFPHRASETLKTHFNEVSLRKIGNLVADKYINEYLKAKEKGQRKTTTWH